MAHMSKVSKERLLLLIDELEAKPDDKIRILGDVGIVSISALGAPLASVAAITGVKSVFGLSVAAKIFGWMPALLITGPPLALIIGCVSGLGLFAYALSWLVRSGGSAEGLKAFHYTQVVNISHLTIKGAIKWAGHNRSCRALTWETRA